MKTKTTDFTVTSAVGEEESRPTVYSVQITVEKLPGSLRAQKYLTEKYPGAPFFHFVDLAVCAEHANDFCFSQNAPAQHTTLPYCGLAFSNPPTPEGRPLRLVRVAPQQRMPP